MSESLPKPDNFKEIMDQLANELELPDTAAPREKQLENYAEFLKQSHDWVKRYHKAGESGLVVVHCRSIAVDALLQHLYEYACSRVREDMGELCAPVTLVALGGYGREEMCPHSDVDLMFLYPQKVRSPDFPEMRQLFNDTILYMLWDLGLKPGHSTRTIKEAIAEANEDEQSKNAMLEARLICGDEKLYRRFTKDYDRFIRKDDASAYLKERLKDQDKRRAKYADTVFLQEPEIKNGVGGLRDYQNMLWMTRLQYDGRDLSELVKLGLIRQKEHDQLRGAYDFLLRVRNELHFQSKRPTDILDIDKQPKVAWGVGYKQHSIFPRVEAFMRDYYKATYKIYHLSCYLEKRLSLNAHTSVSFGSVLRSRRLGKADRFDGFVAQGGILEAESTNVFKQDPVRLIRVFRHMQSRDLELDFDLERLIVENLELIDRSIVESEDANRAFRSILQSKGNVYPALNLMNTTGVLPRFIPEWKGLHCLVQHEYYHRYTADEHVLKTIRHLDAIISGETPELTRKYRQALEETELPGLLYLILFLHDIGKGKSIEGHAETGAKMAVPILQRLQVVKKAREKIIFLIKNHLEMARIWQRYDLDDPETGRLFSNKIRNSELLRYLFVLTFCDARGTSKSLWNGFKDTLHHQLYKITLGYLQSPSLTPPALPMISQAHILNKVTDLSEEEVEAHFNLLPDRYFSYHNEKEILLHLRMVNSLLQNISEADSLGSLKPVVEWENDVNLGLTVVHIVTWDRAGLFYKLSGALTLAGLSIVSSKALSRADHISIDTFYVSDPEGGLVDNPETQKIFSKYLDDSLIHNKDLLGQIEEQAKKFNKPSYVRTDVTLPTSIPVRVDVYHEMSLKRTIIEVEANDELGLLYKLSRTISEHGYDIAFARISTERKVAVDTFYIEPDHPSTEEENSQNLIELKADLLKVLEASSSSEEG
ncbi:MAG: [protein-PII] uridylyltransferase [Puniceicoccaceae bacterium]